MVPQFEHSALPLGGGGLEVPCLRTVGLILVAVAPSAEDLLALSVLKVKEGLPIEVLVLARGGTGPTIEGEIV